MRVKIEIIFVVRHASVGLISIGIRILMLGVCVANKGYSLVFNALSILVVGSVVAGLAVH